MKVLITGSEGFVGKNISLKLRERGHETLAIVRGSSVDELRCAVRAADAVVHLAGVNRPKHEDEFRTGNSEFTRRLCEFLADRKSPVPVIFSSTVQVHRDSDYGRSKRQAEQYFADLGSRGGWAINVCRLANVFGKWCRPDYNSVVATFCHNIARGIPIRVDDPEVELKLIYIDDVADAWIKWLECPVVGVCLTEISPQYRVKLGELAAILRSYRDCRSGVPIAETSRGLGRALYATYLSYLPREDFSYTLKRHEDVRGVFVEFLRTRDSGQVSFFTAKPGVTRGGHYHHTKTEKFLVVGGTAKFRFRCLRTGSRQEVLVAAGESRVVETVPGWIHDVTNVGAEDLVCLLWANEPFDHERPDTYSSGLE